MSFYDKVYSLDVPDILSTIPYETQVFDQTYKVNMYLNDIIKFKKKVYIYGDYDPDGGMCARGFRDFFDYIGHRNYIVFKYANRMHTLDPLGVESAINNNVDYMIICDTGSSEMSQIKRLVSRGIKCIILDHHETKYSYEDFPEEVAHINVVLENRLIEENIVGSLSRPVYQLSAGALVFCVLENYLTTYGYDLCTTLPCYGLLSLYSDSMDMANKINRSIYYLVKSLPNNGYPDFFYDFLNKYITISRRFFEWIVVPRINASFRAERFKLLNPYLLESRDDKDPEEIHNLVEDLKEFHGVSADIVKTIADIVDCNNSLDNFVIADLSSVPDRLKLGSFKYQNHTGLVANKVSDKYNKPCICLCQVDGKIRGSFRDLKSRDFLTRFRVFSNSNGHKPAFGISIDTNDFGEFIRNLSRLDKHLNISNIENEIIKVIDYKPYPDLKLLNDMARYNEFSGTPKVPLAFLETRLTGAMREQRDSYGSFNYDWSGVRIKSSKRLRIGSTILLRPTYGVKLTLHVCN